LPEKWTLPALAEQYKVSAEPVRIAVQEGSQRETLRSILRMKVEGLAVRLF